jgi:MoxR-like ATPase
MLLVGPPGVAKTRSARVFGALVGLSPKSPIYLRPPSIGCGGC